MESVSLTDAKYASKATEQAMRSNCLMRHGCIAVTAGKITGSGYNKKGTSDPFNRHSASCHAEMDAIRHIQLKVAT